MPFGRGQAQGLNRTHVHRVTHGGGGAAVARDGLRRGDEHRVTLAEAAPFLGQRQAEERAERLEALAGEDQLAVVLGGAGTDFLLADLDQLLAQRLLLVGQKPIRVEHRIKSGLRALNCNRHDGLLLDGTSSGRWVIHPF